MLLAILLHIILLLTILLHIVTIILLLGIIIATLIRVLMAHIHRRGHGISMMLVGKVTLSLVHVLGRISNGITLHVHIHTCTVLLLLMISTVGISPHLGHLLLLGVIIIIPNTLSH